MDGIDDVRNDLRAILSPERHDELPERDDIEPEEIESEEEEVAEEAPDDVELDSIEASSAETPPEDGQPEATDSPSGEQPEEPGPEKPVEEQSELIAGKWKSGEDAAKSALEAQAYATRVSQENAALKRELERIRSQPQLPADTPFEALPDEHKRHWLEQSSRYERLGHFRSPEELYAEHTIRVQEEAARHRDQFASRLDGELHENLGSFQAIAEEFGSSSNQENIAKAIYENPGLQRLQGLSAEVNQLGTMEAKQTLSATLSVVAPFMRDYVANLNELFELRKLKESLPGRDKQMREQIQRELSQASSMARTARTEASRSQTMGMGQPRKQSVTDRLLARAEGNPGNW